MKLVFFKCVKSSFQLRYDYITLLHTQYAPVHRTVANDGGESARTIDLMAARSRVDFHVFNANRWMVRTLFVIYPEIQCMLGLPAALCLLDPVIVSFFFGTSLCSARPGLRFETVAYRCVTFRFKAFSVRCESLSECLCGLVE